MDLIKLVVLLVAGILVGYFLRNQKRINFSKVTFGIIIVLMFSLGFTIGSNNELLNSLPRVGLNAVVILLLAMMFSVLFVKLVRRSVNIE